VLLCGVEKIIYNKSFVLVGYFLVMILAILGMILQIIRGFEGMEAAWAISTGMEILSLFVCSAVFYSFLNADESDSKMRVIFSALLVTSALCIFCDEVAWLVQSIPEFAVINRLSNSLLYINSFAMTLLFWRYLIYSFNVKTRLAGITTKVLIICWFPAAIIAFLNLFIPIYFSVDINGTYEREALYPLHMIYYALAIPSATIEVVRSKVSWSDKIAALTFYVFPILGIIISIYMFGISTSSVCTMLPIVLNYCVIVSNRERKYAVTQNGLEIANNIQKGILPESDGAFPDRRDFDISASMSPAQTVGGDFYDFFLVDDTHLAILIADVSDKGIPAALFMTISKVFMKTRIEMGGTPSEIISYADKRISSENEAGFFITLWLGIIDLSTGHVEACNAGHDYPAIYSLSEGYKVEKTPHGPPIAFIPGMEFPGIEFDLKPGESIFLYTDGLIEAKKKDGSRFGVDRMLDVLRSSSNKPNKQLIQDMKSAVMNFVDDEPQFDDMTMLAFTYKGKDQGSFQ